MFQPQINLRSRVYTVNHFQNCTATKHNSRKTVRTVYSSNIRVNPVKNKFLVLRFIIDGVLSPSYFMATFLFHKSKLISCTIVVFEYIRTQ